MSGYLERTGESCSRNGASGVELKHEKEGRWMCVPAFFCSVHDQESGGFATELPRQTSR